MPIYQRISVDMAKVIQDNVDIKAVNELPDNKDNTYIIWRIFWATENSHDLIKELYNLGCNDSHIDTLLTYICKKHGMFKQNSQVV